MLNNKLEYLTCYTGLIDGDKLYVVNILFGVVVEYDLEDGSHKILTKIELPEKMQAVRVNSILKMNEKMYVIFWDSHQIYEYTLDFQKCRIYGEDFRCDFEQEIVRKAFSFEDTILLFPRIIDCPILFFDVKTKKYTECSSVLEKFKEQGITVTDDLCLLCAEPQDNKIWGAVNNTSYLFLYDIETDACKIYNIGEGYKISRIICNQDELYLSFHNQTVIGRWNPKQGWINTYSTDVQIDSKGGPFSVLFLRENKLFAVSSFEKCTYIIDINNYRIQKIEYTQDIRRIHRNERRTYFFEGLGYQDKLLLLPFAGSAMIFVDMNMGEIRKQECIFSKSEIEKYYLNTALDSGKFAEVDGWNIKDYVEYLEEYAKNRQVQKKWEGVGASIFAVTSGKNE